MKVTFVDRPDGGVDVRVDDERSLFALVFSDAITADRPRGAPRPNVPSTHWIDRARRDAMTAGGDSSGDAIAHGNIVIVTVEDDQAVARLDVDPVDAPGEAMPVARFIEILDAWRARLVARCPEAADNHPPDPSARPLDPEATDPPAPRLFPDEPAGG